MTDPHDPEDSGETDMPSNKSASTPPETFARLRRRAEERLSASDGQAPGALAPVEAERLIQELRVHQIELELQNDELLRTQEALEISRSRYFDLYDLAPIGYITLTDTGTIQEANLAAATLLETPRVNLAGRPLTRFILPKDQDILYRCRHRLTTTREPQTCELRLQRAQGPPCWVRLDVCLEPHRTGHQGHWRATLSDITATKEGEQSLRDTRARLSWVAGIAEVGFLEWNPRTGAIVTPPAEQAPPGKAEVSASPRSLDAWLARLHPDDRERVRADFARFAAGGVTPREVHYRRRSKKDDYRWFACRLEPIPDTEGRFDRILIVHQDITRRKESEDKAIRRAQLDPLTELPTRSLLDPMATQMLAGAGRSGRRLAVLFVDLDAFKAVNDEFGHSVGDEVLRQTAQRLRACFRAGDLITRLGGDEFLIVLDNILDDDDAATAARTAIDALSRPYPIADREVTCPPSIGISLYPDDGATIDALIKGADLAMYHAKQVSPGQFQFFSAALDRQSRAVTVLQDGLRDAVSGNGFRLLYQPVLDLGSGAVVGVEALLRWPQPGGGEIAPSVFLPIAESIGLIHDVGAWVLREACRQHRAWLDAGLPPIAVTVNVSARQFRHRSFLRQLTDALLSGGVDPSLMSLAVGEATLLRDRSASRQLLAKLHALGVHVVLDDFGLGPSCLGEIEDLSLDSLEINRTLLHRLDDRPHAPAMMETIVRLGRAMQIKVTAIGIETEAELTCVRDLGCDQAQGFYLGKPMTGSELADWYRRQPPAPGPTP
ncbi:putative bifunctional diguanylate cyclase/phosphodiesterase [Thiocapsa marina]|uniref:Diguanylate cyclase/phosphodiesterase with PAS/PAC sensor(S) n=1 Tax=Thiocapsa marina 5811 TaxID=768671 RepID=F9UFF7_9GAMM|nr:GGDEF and EAL domain-containing protein [Thiocapsa marina]EGV17194.1 diguanylate cyclase/phosphodiesterase with PAS/PAC sensor(s) [Thiocapsa marina 5811]